VEFIEQPMPAEMIEETRWVHDRVHIPIIADEACERASDIPKLKGAYDGVNVKSTRAAASWRVNRIIQVARGWAETMLGCMVSSSVTVPPRRTFHRWWITADLDGTC